MQGVNDSVLYYVVENRFYYKSGRKRQRIHEELVEKMHSVYSDEWEGLKEFVAACHRVNLLPSRLAVAAHMFMLLFVEDMANNIICEDEFTTITTQMAIECYLHAMYSSICFSQPHGTLQMPNEVLSKLVAEHTRHEPHFPYYFGSQWARDLVKRTPDVWKSADVKFYTWENPENLFDDAEHHTRVERLLDELMPDEK